MKRAEKPWNRSLGFIRLDSSSVCLSPSLASDLVGSRAGAQAEAPWEGGQVLEGPTGLQRKAGQEGTCWEQEAREASDIVPGF